MPDPAEKVVEPDPISVIEAVLADFQDANLGSPDARKIIAMKIVGTLLEGIEVDSFEL